MLNDLVGHTAHRELAPWLAERWVNATPIL
jgi:hypothetical protein